MLSIETAEVEEQNCAGHWERRPHIRQVQTQCAWHTGGENSTLHHIGATGEIGKTLKACE